ncbi:amidohydrolase family protein [Actinophytocola gossypii]|uniref:Amidohydrolase family protein n=1 Tax=Actinophytocola gossypii TaxID=2812003 RepID=A0ABT2JLF1_9PSEU|nr:amidohydrolase family protein [Actinophytocola gossypii]MCT2588220.1 amidohydrolase family protein [Actinophytocola gossypii]
MIDAHHHLWDPATRDHPWMAGDALAPIRRPYTLDDLRAVTPATRTILVQTVSDEAETDEFLATAGGLVAGVVGWVDLTAPDIADRLAGHHELLVGVRHQAEDEPDPRWLLRPDVLRGLHALADADLAYDVLVRPPQLPAAVELAGRVPTRLVLDHAGKPPIATGAMEPWATAITELARHPNVTCKLSGLVTEADWATWSIDDLRPYADHVLTAFGPDRVMFGSDWPVCELAATYSQVTAAAEALTAGLSEAERAAVFGGTAARVYGV